MSELHFVYFADPMCSWCYGFSPVITELVQRFEGRLGLRVVTGGLRAGHAAPMRAEDKAYIRDAWTRVAAASIVINMTVALIHEAAKGDPIELPALYLLGALAILIAGAGRFSVDSFRAPTP